MRWTKTEMVIAAVFAIAFAVMLMGVIGVSIERQQEFTCRNHGKIPKTIWIDGNPLCKACILEIVPVVVERESKWIDADL